MKEDHRCSAPVEVVQAQAIDHRIAFRIRRLSCGLEATKNLPVAFSPAFSEAPPHMA